MLQKGNKSSELQQNRGTTHWSKTVPIFYWENTHSNYVRNQP